MFKKLKTKLLACLTTVACAAAAFGVWAQAGFAMHAEANAEETVAPITLTIESNNVSYSDSVYVLYAVSVEGVDVSTADIKMAFWDETQTESNPEYVSSVRGIETVHGKECAIFYSYGLAAKEMTDNVFCRAYAVVDGETYYSEVLKYNVVQYTYEMKQTLAGKSDEKSLLQLEMFDAMLNYGAAAQKLLHYKEETLANDSRYQWVDIKNANLGDGFGYGMYLVGTELTITPAFGYEFTGDNSAYTVEDGVITFTVPAETFVDEESFTKLPSAEELAQQKVEAVAAEFTYDAPKMYAGDEATLPAETSVADVSVAWTMDENEYMVLAGNTLTAKAVGSVTLTATFTYMMGGVAFTAARTFVVAVSDFETLTIPQAVEMGSAQATGEYTTQKYYVTGKIVSIENTTHGNVYIQDEEGNKLYVYGLYDANGNRYDKMAVKPVVGYTLKLLSVVGNYNGAPQLKSATVVEMVEPTAEEKVAFEVNAIVVVESLMEELAAELPVVGVSFADVAIAWAITEGAECATLDGGVLTAVSAGNVTLTATVTCGEASTVKTFTVVIEEKVEPTTFSKTYTFANYVAGKQYAENEVHELDEFVTVTVDNGHFTTQLRLYSSSSNNSTAIIKASNVIDKISFNAGNKVDTLNIYGSTDGVTFTAEPIAQVQVTSTSYKDYEVDIDENGFYKYLKLDVEGTQQIRIASFTIDIFIDGKEPQMSDESKVEMAMNSFEMKDFSINGGSSVELSTATSIEGVTVAWSADSEYATIEGATLTVENVQAMFTLTATLICGEASATKTCTVTVIYVMSDGEKAEAAAEEFAFDYPTEINGGEEITLSTDSGYEGVTLAWAIAEDEENATLTDNVLAFANPMGGAKVVIYATFTCGEEEVTIGYEISVSYVPDEQKVENEADKFEFTLTKIFVGDVKELNTTAVDEDVVITWTLEETDSAILEGNVLTAVDVGEITLTVTFSFEEFTAVRTYVIEIAAIETLTIAAAIELGKTFEKDNYTAEKYYVSGTVLEVTNTEYGNMYIGDEEGNKILIYGVYDVDGNRYDAMATKPTAGYTVKLLGVVGMYTEAQMKNATIVEMAEPTDEYKVNAEANALTLVGNATGAKEITLVTAPKSFTDVTISWTTDAEIASIVDGVLVIENPDEDTKITVIATVACGEYSAVKEFTITVAHQDEGTTVEPTTLATFALGANGTASHNDGSSATTYTETVNGYTLNITGGNKMYKGARDAKGNSCLKFGTSSGIGSMTFTVPEAVTEVIIYVAKYKANTTKLTVGGSTITLTKNSNDGEYDEIKVDTTTNKTVSFTTVSGGARAMLNTIVFIGIA